jgi:hypothetical protein
MWKEVVKRPTCGSILELTLAGKYLEKHTEQFIEP